MTLAITTTTHEIQPTTTLEEMAEAWKEYVQVKDVTMNSYWVCLRSFLDWTRDNNVAHPQREDVKAYVAFLASPHPRRTKDGKPGAVITFSAGTQARYLRAVKLFFRWTSQETGKFYYPNVADNIKGAKVRQDNTHRDPLQREDAMAVLDSIDRSNPTGKRDYAMILLSITAGLRIIEMQRANIGNMEVMAGENVLYVQGKGHDEADTYKKLTPEVHAAIMDYLGTRGKLEGAAPLFASEGHRNNGGRLTEPSISRIIKRRLQAAGYDTHRLTAHSLRHTSVTMLLESGATLQEAQHHARHASPETTGIYAHNIDQRKQHAEQRVYDYLFGIEHDQADQAAESFARLTEDQQRQILALMQTMAA